MRGVEFALRIDVFDFIFLLALTIAEGIPTDFGPAELMIFGGPRYSERLLNPPEDPILSQELLDFAERRPYAKDIPNWWRPGVQTTKEIAHKIQELEELNSTLPPLTDVYRFPDPKSLQAELDFAQQYYRGLAERARFMLKEEQDIVEALISHYESMRFCYYNVISCSHDYTPYIERRMYLQQVKDAIPLNLYEKGILPKLTPNPLP